MKTLTSIFGVLGICFLISIFSCASNPPKESQPEEEQISPEVSVDDQEQAPEAQQAPDKEQEIRDKISQAEDRLDWASSIVAKRKFPCPYDEAKTAYREAQRAANQERWDDAAANADTTIEKVAEIERLYNELLAKEEQEQAENVKDAIAKAKSRLDWANSINAKSRFPGPYNKAESQYQDALKAQNSKDWDGAVSNADNALTAVNEIEQLNNQAVADASKPASPAAVPPPAGRSPGMNTGIVPPAAAQAEAERVKKEQEAAAQAEAERVRKEQEAAAEAERVKSQQTNDALSKAKERLDWAASIQARTKFPEPYNQAENAYNEAVRAKNNKNWDEAAANAAKVVSSIAEIEALNEKALADAAKAAAEKEAADKAAAEKAAAEAANAEKAKTAADALAKAKERMDWANSIQARTKFPQPYNRANTAYNNAVRANTGKNYDNAVTNANQAIAAVAEIEELNEKALADAAKAAAEKEAAAVAAAEKALADAARAKAEQEAAEQAAAERAAREQAAAEAAARAKAEQEAAAQIAAEDAARAEQEVAEQAAAEDAVRPEQEPATQVAAEDVPRAEQETAAQVATEDAARPEQESQTVTEAPTEESVPQEQEGQETELSVAEPTASESLDTPDGEAEAKSQTASKALADAQERLDLAVKVNGERVYPDAYRTAENAYREAADAFAVEDWDTTISAASAVITALNVIEGLSPLPSQYEVRTWINFRDCFWNIAGYPFVYNDPFEWRRLYTANSEKLQNRQNPDIIEPGVILDIPSIRDEYREGLWEESKRYPPLPGMNANR
ncbi:MAG: hypothetical protein LBP76_06485 [Treponema sp.]|jgi:hypothetical protein|nr:hypothetical protein [Treponema sp.]